mmetsp:Transcript_29222/g.33396  ORF Transcript_29222/g.33396 Transcript_29222/m.33396 type:complete len:92 (+) Transcript_29222:669-944(+)
MTSLELYCHLYFVIGMTLAPFVVIFRLFFVLSSDLRSSSYGPLKFLLYCPKIENIWASLISPELFLITDPWFETAAEKLTFHSRWMYTNQK